MAETPSVQQERAELILNVAAELLLRWGYKKVTINDIAQQAGIGTGTVYLHWKTKEALFETVIVRETLAVWSEVLERMRRDVRELYPHRMMSTSLLISLQRPIMRAILLGDGALLGKLAQSKIALRTRMMSTPESFLLMLREYGLMRTDMDVHRQLFAFSAVVTGFCTVDAMIAQEDQVSLEERVDSLAYVIRESFEPMQLITVDVLHDVVAPHLLKIFEMLVTGLTQQLRDSQLL